VDEVQGNEAGNKAGDKAGDEAGDKAGDELAARREFHALVAPYMSTLKARAIQLCRSHCDADDLIQDTLLRAFGTRGQLQDVTRARPWLLTILTHMFIDAVRKRRRRPELVPLPTEHEIPDSIPDEPALWHNVGVDDLRAAIERLPDDIRDTYRMCALDGHDHATIAKAQRVATATVGTRIFRARKQLRVLLMAAARRAGSL
jgi:RNA polymerase sigma-70 factor (ECF subfamily)